MLARAEHAVHALLHHAGFNKVLLLPRTLYLAHSAAVLPIMQHFSPLLYHCFVRPQGSYLFLDFMMPYLCKLSFLLAGTYMQQAYNCQEGSSMLVAA